MHLTFLLLFSVICLISPISLISLISPIESFAQTSKSNRFTIQTGITPQPTPFKPIIQSGFPDNDNILPIRLTISSDLIGYGTINPTNPIKRKISISVDSGSAGETRLFAFANHPLQEGDNNIPDTTCDDGACNQKNPSTWNNPLTFGLGFSSDDINYRQFADDLTGEKMVTISPADLTIKLNVSQNQPIPADKHYENTLIFLAIPKY